MKFSKQIFDDMLIAFYIEWVNDWLTVEKMSEYYSITQQECQDRIDKGRELHELQFKQLS